MFKTSEAYLSFPRRGNHVFKFLKDRFVFFNSYLIFNIIQITAI